MFFRHLDNIDRKFGALNKKRTTGMNKLFIVRHLIIIVRINLMIGIAAITIGSLILFTQNTSFNRIKSTSPELRIVSLTTDKQVYHSNDKMEIMLEIFASNDVENVDVKVFGIKDRGDNYRLNKVEKQNLTSGINTLTFPYKTPSCYGCSGIKAGLYQITTLVSYDDMVMNESVEIEMKR